MPTGASAVVGDGGQERPRRGPGDRPTGRDSPRLPWWVTLAVASLAFGAAFLAFGRHPVDDTPRFSRVVKLVATDAIESSPVLSPDGKWVAYLSNE